VKISEQEHKQFLQDCKNMTLYFNYKKQIFKHAASYPTYDRREHVPRAKERMRRSG
jgi:hypothetical protein